MFIYVWMVFKPLECVSKWFEWLGMNWTCNGLILGKFWVHTAWDMGCHGHGPHIATHMTMWLFDLGAVFFTWSRVVTRPDHMAMWLLEGMVVFMPHSHKELHDLTTRRCNPSTWPQECYMAWPHGCVTRVLQFCSEFCELCRLVPKLFLNFYFTQLSPW